MSNNSKFGIVNSDIEMMERGEPRFNNGDETAHLAALPLSDEALDETSNHPIPTLWFRKFIYATVFLLSMIVLLLIGLSVIDVMILEKVNMRSSTVMSDSTMPTFRPMPTSMPTSMPTNSGTDNWYKDGVCKKGIVSETSLMLDASSINAHLSVFDVEVVPVGSDDESAYMHQDNNVCSSHFDVVNPTNIFEVQVLNASLSTTEHFLQYSVLNETPLSTVSLTVPQPFDTYDFWCYTVSTQHVFVHNDYYSCKNSQFIPVENSTFVYIRNDTSTSTITFDIYVENTDILSVYVQFMEAT